jgi:hypothetical protein
MKAKIILSAIGITLLGSAAVLAQGQAQGPQKPMSFFITSTTEGSGNLGGLAGADKICQDLAAASGAGNRTWHAYLSQQQQGNEPAVNARGRIGNGPWYNAKGVLIASNVGDLHGDNLRDRNNIQKANMLDEKGVLIKGAGDMPNQHDILTGFGFRRPCVPAGLRHDLQQLDVEHRREPRDARSCRPHRRRQHFLELGAYERRLLQGIVGPYRRRRPSVLLRDQLRRSAA